MESKQAAWPALAYADWVATKKTLHMYAQMLGKLRLALAPPQPEWLHSCLHLDALGLTTGPIPWQSRLLWGAVDLREAVLRLRLSDGRAHSVSLADGRCVADVWRDFQAGLKELGVAADVWEKPQETTDTTEFSHNRHDCSFDAAQAQRFHAVLARVQAVFEEFRAQFFGRNGVQFWWGGFDLTVLLFSGRKVDPPTDRGYIMRYDLDAEHLSAGFWPGADSAPSPVFYGYLVPRPPGCETAPVKPASAGWIEEMSYWQLPYDAVRESPDPHRALLDFLNSIYALAFDLGGWQRRAYEYAAPAPPLRDRP